jgi:citronellyl-CoA dehydrogenase
LAVEHLDDTVEHPVDDSIEDDDAIEHINAVEHDDAIERHVARLVAPAACGSGDALLATLGRAGLLARCRPDGGAGGLDHWRRLLTALVGQVGSGPLLSCVVHTATFLPLVAKLGGDRFAEVVDDARAGRAVGGLAVTDADHAGSDLASLSTAVTIAADKLVLTGAKTWITNALFADFFVVLARHRAARHLASLSLVLVPASAPGVTRAAVATPVMAGSGIGTVAFDGVELPPEHLLGRPGRGFGYFSQQMAVERLAGGIWTVALARRLIGETVGALRDRDVDGRPLWQRSSVRHILARMAVQVRLVEALVDDIVAAGLRTGVVPGHDAAVLKAAVGPLAHQVVEACLHLTGAKALTDARGLLALLADCCTFGIAGGSTETMLDIVADQLANSAKTAAMHRAARAQ